MKVPTSRPSSRRHWAVVALLVPAVTLLVFMLIISLSSRSLPGPGSEAGSIVLEDARLRWEARQLLMSADAEIELPEPIRAGLGSGVPLDFILTLTFRQPRAYWFDHTLARYEHRFRLTYYELTRHYRVLSVDTGTSRNFRSLSAALEGLGTFRNLPAVTLTPSGAAASDDGFFEPDAARSSVPIVAALELRLDSKALPLPLQPLIASSWHLSSEEYQWLYE